MQNFNNIVITSPAISMRIEFKPSLKKKILSFGLYGELQKYIDAYCLNGITPYMPFRMGTAERSGMLHTEIGSGMIVQKTPYIRYIYYGKVMVGTPPKQVTNKDLIYDISRHSKAGKEWWVRFKADNMKALEESVKKKAKELFK